MPLRRGLPDPWRGLATGAALVLVATVALVPARHSLTLAGPALVLVLPVVAAGLLGGRTAAVATSVLAAAAVNVAFIPPYWTFSIDRLDDALALAVFIVVGVAVGTLSAREAQRRSAAEQRAEEMEALHGQVLALSDERGRRAGERERIAVLERVDEQRSALLRSVSHDLRTPLATIRAVASDLRSGTAYDAATRDELLDLVGDEAERLDRIVANLLSLSRIEAGALHPDRQAVAVDELIEACVARLRRLLGKVRLQVAVSPGLPLVDVDYSQIDQVLSNLLENAVRHSPQGSLVQVEGRLRSDLVEVAVTDEGPGLLPFERAALFEPFQRGRASTSSGVGLAICKAFVEAHSGTVEVGEGTSGGARFSFTLPVHRG